MSENNPMELRLPPNMAAFIEKNGQIRFDETKKMYEDGKINQAGLSQIFNTSTTAMNVMIKVLGWRVPPKAGRPPQLINSPKRIKKSNRAIILPSNVDETLEPLVPSAAAGEIVRRHKVEVSRLREFIFSEISKLKTANCMVDIITPEGVVQTKGYKELLSLTKAFESAIEREREAYGLTHASPPPVAQGDSAANEDLLKEQERDRSRKEVRKVFYALRGTVATKHGGRQLIEEPPTASAAPLDEEGWRKNVKVLTPSMAMELVEIE